MKRETFAKIAEQKHPSNPQLYTPEIRTPDDLDISISEEIIELYHKCQSNNSDGEWKWIDNKRIEYIKALQEKDVDTLSNILCNFFLNKSSYGIISPSLTEVEDYMKDQVMCDIDTIIEFSGLDDLDSISLNKNETGNPFGIENEDKVIQFDFPRVRHIEYIADDFKINKNKYKLSFKMISPFFGGSGRYRIYKYKKIK